MNIGKPFDENDTLLVNDVDFEELDDYAMYNPDALSLIFKANIIGENGEKSEAVLKVYDCGVTFQCTSNEFFNNVHIVQDKYCFEDFMSLGDIGEFILSVSDLCNACDVRLSELNFADSTECTGKNEMDCRSLKFLRECVKHVGGDLKWSFFDILRLFVIQEYQSYRTVIRQKYQPQVYKTYVDFVILYINYVEKCISAKDEYLKNKEKYDPETKHYLNTNFEFITDLFESVPINDVEEFLRLIDQDTLLDIHVI